MSYNKPLEGIKIVEISTIVTASLATMMMADQGAEVIKIEQSGIGDPMRYLGTQKGGVSALFANCNRGKRSIDLNLKEKDDLEIVKKLISNADILINNFRPGVMDKIGLGESDCKKLNDKLIYASINGFGVIQVLFQLHRHMITSYRRWQEPQTFNRILTNQHI